RRHTSTRHVRRDEVLKYVQALTEVRFNRRFNNRAVWARHQATHTGQLTNLGRRAPRARLSVHKYRVERSLLLFFTFAIDDSFFTDTFHHRLGDEVVST